MSTSETPEPNLDESDPALPELDLLLEQLNADNETISFLLKAHLYSEYYLDRLLATYLGEKREPLERIYPSFAQKLTLVDAFALLPQDCVRSLRALNKLRNKCVHNFNTRPSLEDVRRVALELADFPRPPAQFANVRDVLSRYMIQLFGRFTGTPIE